MKGYIYSVFEHIVDNSNVVDLFYINLDLYKKSDNINTEIKNIKNMTECLRIKNFNLSFLIAQPVNMNKKEFSSFISNCVDDCSKYRIKTNFRNDYVDASFFKFGNKTNYCEVSSTNTFALNEFKKIIVRKLKIRYERMNIDKLDGWDKLFYENTENPFRFTLTTTKQHNVKYYLSTKYNIPCVGGFRIENKNILSKETYTGNLKLFSDIKVNCLDCKCDNNILNKIIKDEHIDCTKYLTLFTYDIETYTQKEELSEKDKIIMCIGYGLFNLESQIPYIKKCIICEKDFTEKDIEQLSDNIEIKTTNHCKIYTVKNTYIDNDKKNTSFPDKSIYYVVKNEKALLDLFITQILSYRPTFIGGFNNYGFDDKYIWERVLFYNDIELKSKFLQAFSWYSLKSLIQQDMPKFENINLKIDGQLQNDAKTWVGNSTISIDVFKIILASDPKLYTQRGRGNLDTMLAMNKVVNPYTNNPLSKSGLSYVEMYKKWDSNTDIYKIALYCMQDAWICGTLIIKTSQLIDKIEMSALSRTTIYDSIVKAVTHRVGYTTLAYAYKYKFAVMDEMLHETVNNKVISRGESILGIKKFDSRKIKGGEVRSVHPGKHNYVVALDFSAMYPSQKEASNVDNSSLVPEDIIKNPENYGLKIKYIKNINDMYNQRNIYYFDKIDINNSKNINVKNNVKNINVENNVENINVENNNSFDYCVEEFNCEYKNDVKLIEKYVDTYNSSIDSAEKEEAINILKTLYPENYYGILKGDNINENTFKKNYFVQSPKSKETGLPEIHYSLKEIMLSDLRALRNSVKQLQSQAHKKGDKLLESRYNAKQNAIKILCNSEYGASGSQYFAYYDKDIGGSVTYASRMLIGFLTNVIESEELFCDKDFLQKNNEYLQLLLKYNVLNIKEIEPEDIPRRLSVRILFDEYYNFIKQKIFKIHIQKSKVIYQDTDSNYYINEYVQKIFKDNLNPENIQETMNIMLAHNNFIGNIAKEIVFRRPVGLGFEGAFIVARYFNVKKKYFGVKWIPGEMQGKLCSEAYVDNILINNYNKYWKPKISTLPMEDGNYVNINANELLRERIDYLEYINNQNVKCTGVDLARRDQYKFINFNHVFIIQNDMRVMKYNGDNVWNKFGYETLEESINMVLDTFKNQIERVNTIIYNMENNIEENYELPTNFYSLEDYSKNFAYKPDKKNQVQMAIIKRLKSEGKEYLIPEIFARVNYVIILTEKTKDLQIKGKTDDGKTTERSYLLDELYKSFKDELPEEKYKQYKYSDKINYDIYIELKIISNLDFRYYMKQLCSSMSIYALEYLEPDVLRTIDSGEIESNKIPDKIKKAKKNITELLMKKYFNYGKDSMKKLNDIDKNITKNFNEKNIDGYKAFISITSKKNVELNSKTLFIYKHELERKLKDYSNDFVMIENIIRINNTNMFINFKSNDEKKNLYNELFKQNPDKIYDMYESLQKAIIKYKCALKFITEECDKY